MRSKKPDESQCNLRILENPEMNPTRNYLISRSELNPPVNLADGPSG